MFAKDMLDTSQAGKNSANFKLVILGFAKSQKMFCCDEKTLAMTERLLSSCGPCGPNLKPVWLYLIY